MAFIKVQSTKNNLGNIVNLLKNFVLGDRTPVLFSETDTYNTGDIVYRVVDDEVSMYEATHDGITGPFNETDWSTFSFGGSSVVISETKPTTSSAGTWLKPVREGTYDLPEEFI